MPGGAELRSTVVLRGEGSPIIQNKTLFLNMKKIRPTRTGNLPSDSAPSTTEQIPDYPEFPCLPPGHPRLILGDILR